MLTTERQAIITQLLKEKQTITLQDIIDATPASESTIRRDLTDLEKQGKLVRIHGDATISERKLQELTFSEKSTKNLQEKVNLAKLAASLVQKEDCIYLDAGSTVIQMIPYLAGKDIVVVTNGLTHVEALTEHGITTYLIGGLMKTKTSAVVGQQAIASLNNYRSASCVLGARGSHPIHGYTAPAPEEAAAKRTSSTRAQETDVVGDPRRCSHTSFAQVRDLKSAPL